MRALAWLDELDAHAVLGAFPAHAPALLLRATRYLDAPAACGEDAVRAVVQGARGRATVLLSRPAGGSARWRADCTCRAWGQCEHVAEVLLDLALSAPLRDALRGDGEVALAVSRLPLLRDALQHRQAAEQVATSWLPVQPASEVRAPEYLLVLPLAADPTGPLQRRCVGFDGTPLLEVRLRIAGQRALLDPSRLALASLPAEDRAIVRLLHPLGGARKAFKATGVEAAIALEFLARHAASRARLEGDDAAPTFARDALSLHIVATRLPRHRLSLRAPEEGAPRALYGAQAGRWEDAPPENDEAVDALEARWRSADGRVEVRAADAVLFRGPFPRLWCPTRRAFFPVDPAADLDVAWHAQIAPAVELPRGHAERVLRALRRRLRGRSVHLPTLADVGAEDAEARFVLRVEGRPLDLRARLEARYPHATIELSLARALEADADDRRDGDLELEAVERVAGTSLAWDEAARCFRAMDDDAARFWREGADALRQGGRPPLAVEVPASLAGTRARAPLAARLAVSREGGLLDVAASFWSDARAVELTRLREALARRRRWVELDDATLAELDDDLAALLDELPPDRDDGATARALVPLTGIGRVLSWAERADGAEALRALAARLRDGDYDGEPEVPEGLRASLRAYQLRGLAWLQWLHGLGLGGVLADDMGLGKTVTALALALWVRARAEGPVLVVAPTSVVGNWCDEAARFTPSLRVRSLHGVAPDLRAAAPLAEADLVVTSWSLLRRDAAWLSRTRFSLAVFDEAQTVKNLDATTARAARAVDAAMRVALTGTPVENRLTELWAILDLCVPGALGSRRAFERLVERPIAQAATAPEGPGRREEAARKLAALRATVRPFVLRRTKRAVLDDLPPRQDVELSCVLDGAHRRLYDALASVLREQVRRARAERVGQSPIGVFTALLRLRQMACDPRLVDPTLTEGGSKRAAFLQHLRALVDAGRRVLVFSQFVELLTLWRKDIEREEIPYVYLDGATTDRAAAVRAFQEGDAPVFLISLKAGGTGLNLTAADTVILCDPWWNPAVEEQAGDRAHRIGQSRAVTVYRLVAKGTIEERVMALKARKRALAEGTLGEWDVPATALDEETLRALFADADAPVVG